MIVFMIRNIIPSFSPFPFLFSSAYWFQISRSTPAALRRCVWLHWTYRRMAVSPLGSCCCIAAQSIGRYLVLSYEDSAPLSWRSRWRRTCCRDFSVASSWMGSHRHPSFSVWWVSSQDLPFWQQPQRMRGQKLDSWVLYWYLWALHFTWWTPCIFLREQWYFDWEFCWVRRPALENGYQLIDYIKLIIQCLYCKEWANNGDHIERLRNLEGNRVGWLLFD